MFPLLVFLYPVAIQCSVNFLKMTKDRLIKFGDYFETASYGFTFIGLNPYFECKNKTSESRKLFNFILFHFCFWLSALTTLLEIGFFLSIMGDKEQLMEFCKTVSCALYDTIAVEQMLLMWLAGKKFNEFILRLEEMFPNDKVTQERYQVQQQAEDTKGLMKKVFTAFIFCFFIWVVGSPAYDILLCYYTDTKYVLELPFKILSPWDLDDPIPYYVALFLEFITMYSSVMIVVSVNMFFVSIVAQIRLQFEMLAQNIRDLTANDYQGLNSIIRQHIRLIDICGQFAELISRTVFVNQMLSSVALCCALFQVVSSTSSEIFRFLVYLMVVTIQTFNMSFVGDSIMQNVRNGICWRNFLTNGLISNCPELEDS